MQSPEVASAASRDCKRWSNVPPCKHDVYFPLRQHNKRTPDVNIIYNRCSLQVVISIFIFFSLPFLIHTPLYLHLLKQVSVSFFQIIHFPLLTQPPMQPIKRVYLIPVLTLYSVLRTLL